MVPKKQQQKRRKLLLFVRVNYSTEPTTLTSWCIYTHKKSQYLQCDTQPRGLWSKALPYVCMYVKLSQVSLTDMDITVLDITIEAVFPYSCWLFWSLHTKQDKILPAEQLETNHKLWCEALADSKGEASGGRKRTSVGEKRDGWREWERESPRKVAACVCVHAHRKNPPSVGVRLNLKKTSVLVKMRWLIVCGWHPGSYLEWNGRAFCPLRASLLIMAVGAVGTSLTTERTLLIRRRVTAHPCRVNTLHGSDYTQFLSLTRTNTQISQSRLLSLSFLMHAQWKYIICVMYITHHILYIT